MNLVNFTKIINEQIAKKNMEKNFAKRRRDIIEQTIDKEKKFFKFKEEQRAALNKE